MSDPAASAAPSSTGKANGDNISAMKEKIAEAAAPIANGSNGSGDKAKVVNGEENGGGDGKSGGVDEDEEMTVDDDDDMGEGAEEDDEVEEIGDDSEEEIITEENSIELDGDPSTGANSSVSGDDNARSDSPQVCRMHHFLSSDQGVQVNSIEPYNFVAGDLATRWQVPAQEEGAYSSQGY